MPEKPFSYPFGIIGNLCNFTEVFLAFLKEKESKIKTRQNNAIFGCISGEKLPKIGRDINPIIYHTSHLS